MRLGQLARKLAIRPIDILDFLSQKEIIVDSDSNARLSDELTTLVTNHFSPPKAPPVIAEAITDIQQPSTYVAEEIKDQTIEEISTTQSTDEEEKELLVIKAPKIELSGLKIIGKIDLPAPKKTETASEQDVPVDKSTDLAEPRNVVEPREKRPFQHKRAQAEQARPRKNPIALQREREMLELEKKKQERALRDKEQRTNNYLKRVRTAAPTKSAKLISEPIEELYKTEDAPKTLLGRFFRWLKK